MASQQLFEVGAVRMAQSVGEPVGQDLTWREAAGLPAPVTSLDVVALLDAEPSPNDVVAAMLGDLDALSHDWLEDHLAQYQRAVDVKALRGAVLHQGQAFATRERRTSGPGRLAAAAAPVASLVDRLAVLVKALPTGDDTLDPTANIDAGTTDELAEVRRVLSQLGTIVGGLALDDASQHLSRSLVAVIEVPDVEPAFVRYLGAPTLNPSGERDAVRSASTYEDHDRLLVDVARGDLAPLTLRLVESNSEVSERAERIGVAHTVQVKPR